MKKLIVVIVSLFVFSTATHAQVNQEKLLESAEQVTNMWSSSLNVGLDILKKNCPEGNSCFWCVRRLTLVGTPSYDVKRTDSIVSPYKLIISFTVKYEDNESGPDTDGHYSKEFEKTWGYASAGSAMRHTNPEDFIDQKPLFEFSGPRDNFIHLSVFYAFQKGSWVLKGGNHLFKCNLFGNEGTPELNKLLSDVHVK